MHRPDRVLEETRLATLALRQLELACLLGSGGLAAALQRVLQRREILQGLRRAAHSNPRSANDVTHGPATTR